MELPSLGFGNIPPQKPVPMNTINATPTAQINTGNLLTPPTTVASDGLSPLSSIINAANAGNTTASQPLPPYNMQSWNLPPPPTMPHSGLTPNFGMGSGITPTGWTNNLARGMFSPSLSSQIPTNTSQSPLRTDNLPPPPFDVSQLPPFGGAPAAMSAPSPLPAIPAQQNMNYMSQSQSQTNPTLQSPLSGTDSYLQRPQSTPSTYYQNSAPSSAAHPTFPPFNTLSSPTTQSPMSAPLMGSRISPVTSQGASFSPSTSQFGFRTQYPYSLPAMSAMSGPASAPLNGPILTNMHNPNNQMSMIGMPSHGMPTGMMQGGYPMNSGQAAHLYGAQQQPTNDRPFKCDQCPQSFNRNHDLKRHKRIHLAVKPFPCTHCDKSFSRKDALKVGAHSLLEAFLMAYSRADLHPRDIFLSRVVGKVPRMKMVGHPRMPNQTLATTIVI